MSKKKREEPAPTLDATLGQETEPTTLAEVAAKQDSSLEVVPVTETLMVPLTDEEYKTLGIKMAHANSEIGRAEEELQSVKSQFKSRIDAEIAKKNHYSSIINAGGEYRPVLVPVSQRRPMKLRMHPWRG
jgi:hypothetical protein